MAFNFPSGAVTNQLYTADSGVVYRFNGITWVVDGVDEKLDSLNEFTSSYYVDSSSFDSKLDNLISATSSYLTSENVIADGGLELTGSISGGFSRIHFVSESSGEVGSNLSTIQLVPDINSPSSEQILIIDPTGGYPNHIHLRPGGPMDNSSTSIILGGENSNVSVVGGTNPPVQITSNNYLWQFNTDGTLIFPDSTNQTTAFTGLPIGSVSGSSQLTSSFDTRYTLSGSVQPLPSNLVSSSAQITAFGFVSSSTSIPAGTISGSSQLTSSFDTRYTLSSSYNTDSSSFNGRFNGLITTGSNTFSGSQVFSGSMTVTSGQVIASSITANSSSLYLTSGSNMYVQNNGIVEITGSLKVKGTARFETVGGDEGGEIEFGVPQTNTSLTSSVKVDVYQNTLRIFDGNTKGVYIDLSKAPTGANGELMWKASGFVNAGDYVTLGNLKARIPTSGMRSLQLATVSGTYSVVGSNLYTANNAAGTSLTSALTITTTPTYLNAGLNFTAVGWLDTWYLMDYVAFIGWRISVIIGPSFNANLITIERLY